MNVVMMPMWIFSGIFFSYERFPAVAIPLIKLLPLTALNDVLRADHSGGQLALFTGRAARGDLFLGRGLILLCGAVLSLDLSALQPCRRSAIFPI